MIFVDTGAWFALSVPSDIDHLSAKQYIASNREQLVTTDYVIDELLTLFRVRRQSQRALQWVVEVLGGNLFELARVTPSDFDRAMSIYRDFSDKQWSFTDCTSFAVMERLSIATAFAFDDHFRQFGSITIHP
ncbi:MAG: type II toxin-antitoxin system VapC family toxin [Pirellulales bacterium]